MSVVHLAQLRLLAGCQQGENLPVNGLEACADLLLLLLFRQACIFFHRIDRARLLLEERQDLALLRLREIKTLGQARELSFGVKLVVLVLFAGNGCR